MGGTKDQKLILKWRVGRGTRGARAANKERRGARRAERDTRNEWRETRGTREAEPERRVVRDARDGGQRWKIKFTPLRGQSTWWNIKWVYGLLTVVRTHQKSLHVSKTWFWSNFPLDPYFTPIFGNFFPLLCFSPLLLYIYFLYFFSI